MYAPLEKHVQEICSHPEATSFCYFAVVNTWPTVLYEQHGHFKNDVHLDYTTSMLGRTSQGNTCLQYKDRLANATWVNNDGTLSCSD